MGCLVIGAQPNQMLQEAAGSGRLVAVIFDFGSSFQGCEEVWLEVESFLACLQCFLRMFSLQKRDALKRATLGVLRSSLDQAVSEAQGLLSSGILLWRMPESSFQ
jgi:hypothetical protein